MVGKERFKEINHILNKELEKKKVLIAVHRGVWGGNIIQNTLAAFKACRQMGADLFECDLSESTDGILYMFHDGNEEQILGTKKSILEMSSQEIDAAMCRNSCGQPSGKYLERFETLLQNLSHGELFNVDRSWESLDTLHEIMKKYPHVISQAIIKTPAEDKYLDFFQNCANKYMYMPIVRSMEDAEKVLTYTDINLVGMEAIISSEDNGLFKDENIQWIRSQNLFFWANVLTLGNKPEHRLYAGYDDDMALLKDPDLSWGKLIDKGINVLQTDWPCQLFQYRQQKLSAASY